MDRASLVARVARWRVPLGFVAGIAAFVLARPTWRTWSAGLAVALVGEALRLWAAGHLEKSREVTRSGPYHWVGHPLYLGSAILGTGVVIAASSVAVAGVAAVYLGVTLTAAIRTEEVFLRRTFGDDYARVRYRQGGAERRFTLERVLRNREHRAVLGLLLGFTLLALKLSAPI